MINHFCFIDTFSVIFICVFVVSCMIWEDEEVKKADLTVLDVGWSIIQKVDKIPQSSDYLMFGVVLSVVIMLLPPLFRAYHSKVSDGGGGGGGERKA